MYLKMLGFWPLQLQCTDIFSKLYDVIKISASSLAHDHNATVLVALVYGQLLIAGRVGPSVFYASDLQNRAWENALFLARLQKAASLFGTKMMLRLY